METITIEWQRLVNDAGQTCDRCATTGERVEQGVARLKRCLVEAGITVVFRKHALDQQSFSENSLESNRLIIDGKTIEQWLQGTTGQSRCCGPCGDAECRTVTIDGVTYEAIPETLILRAGFLAAAEKLRQVASQANGPNVLQQRIDPY